jgi:hypothetical protein
MAKAAVDAATFGSQKLLVKLCRTIEVGYLKDDAIEFWDFRHMKRLRVLRVFRGVSPKNRNQESAK